MKHLFLLAALAVCISSNLSAQANGSFFNLMIGDKPCLFRYEEHLDTVHTRTRTLPGETISEKDTVYNRRFLTLMDTSHRVWKLKPPYLIDTITSIDPVTLREETKMVTNTEVKYNIETEMSYFDFLLLLKSKFEIRNPQKKFRVSSYGIRYESAKDAGMLWISYPATSQGVISKLNCLDKGGEILLYLEAADHDKVTIITNESFLALIHIRK